MIDIRQCEDKDLLVKELAQVIYRIQTEAIGQRGNFSFVLAGGSTPKALYHYLAAAESFDYQWDKWQIFFGDERTVPPDDAESNYRMAKMSLLDYVPIPESQVYRMKGELNPQTAAHQYEEDLRDVFGNDGLPRFDLILLGMGGDGHTASLFPYTDVIHETEKWVVAHQVEKLNTWRITLTPPVINNARHVAFMVTGKEKSERLFEVLKGDYQPDKLPSQIIKPLNGNLYWFVDSAVASYL